MTVYNPGRLCACNCGKLAEGRSKYHNEKCQQRQSRRRDKERYTSDAPRCAEPGCTSARHANGKYCRAHAKHTGHRSKIEKQFGHGFNAVQRGALVYYVGCAEADRMTKTAAHSYLASGAFLPGDKIVMDGVEIVVTPLTL